MSNATFSTLATLTNAFGNLATISASEPLVPSSHWVLHLMSHFLIRLIKGLFYKQESPVAFYIRDLKKLSKFISI